MARWKSLYLYSSETAEALSDHLRETLLALDYTLYDPFGLIPGKAYPLTIRLFIAPPQQGWIRIPIEHTLNSDGEAVTEAVSQFGLCLSVALDGKAAEIDVYQQGEAVDHETALVTVLREGKTADDLNHALNHVASLSSVGEEQTIAVVPVDVLPEDVQAMAQGVNPKQAQKMFGKISKKLLSGEQQAAAKGLLGGDTPDWNSAGGQRIRAVMNCLSMPQHWREPDFTTLRTAYQLHARRRRNPNARLYPGDQEAMEAVPDALMYIPLYGGKDVG